MKPTITNAIPHRTLRTRHAGPKSTRPAQRPAMFQLKVI
jgi:hypothetical protein